MKAPDLAVKVDGRWLHEFGHVSKVEFSTRHGDGPCGPDVATVELDLGPRPTNPGFLTLGRTLEVYDHGVLRFGGVVSGPGTGSPRVVEAKGWARTVWDATLTPEPGARIGRDAFNRPYTPADPYTPRWLLDASQFDIGVADDRLYTQVVATYISALGVDPDPDTVTEIVANDLPAQASFGLLPFALDLTSLGLIDVARWPCPTPPSSSPSSRSPSGRRECLCRRWSCGRWQAHPLTCPLSLPGRWSACSGCRRRSAGSVARPLPTSCSAKCPTPPTTPTP